MDTFDGLARREQLTALGHSGAAIRDAVRHGTLAVPRRGWVATVRAPLRAVRAVELGGRLGGSSALASYGVWVDDDDVLVVSCTPTASRLPDLRPGERRVWMTPTFAPNARTTWRVSLEDAILQLSRTATREELISTIDSAVNKGLLPERSRLALYAALPRRFGKVARDVDGASMSGTETRLRLALRAAGYRVECQVTIPGVGVVDLLVEGWLVLELDSKEHHGSPEQQAHDRARDGNAVLSAYGHERFMWSQVRYSMEWCMAVVEQRVRDGRPDRTPLDRRTHLKLARNS